MKTSLKNKVGKHVELISWTEGDEYCTSRISEHGEVRDMTIEEDYLGSYSILWVIQRDEAGNEIGRFNVLKLDYIKML